MKHLRKDDVELTGETAERVFASAKERAAQPWPRSYKVAVKTKHDKERWHYNGLRFATRGEASAYAVTLSNRWRDIAAHEIEQSDDAPNCFYPVPSDRYDVKRGTGDAERKG